MFELSTEIFVIVIEMFEISIEMVKIVSEMFEILKEMLIFETKWLIYRLWSRNRRFLPFYLFTSLPGKKVKR